MTHTDLHSYQTSLLQQREALRTRLNQVRGGEPTRALASAAHFAGHEDSQAQTNTARDLEFALDEHDKAELRRIDAALQRLELGTYGHCAACGTTIPEARLRATPDAERCIDCQSALEGA